METNEELNRWAFWRRKKKPAAIRVDTFLFDFNQLDLEDWLNQCSLDGWALQNICVIPNRIVVIHTSTAPALTRVQAAKRAVEGNK